MPMIRMCLPACLAFLPQLARKANICQAPSRTSVIGGLSPTWSESDVRRRSTGGDVSFSDFNHVGNATRFFMGLERAAPCCMCNSAMQNLPVARAESRFYVRPITPNETPSKRGIIMAAFDYTRSGADARGLVGGFGAALSRLVARYQAWNDARITRKALNALSDRELDDLGLVRGDIDDIATGTFARR
jgi:uncharacterized protein YjiS (DUF1127 family)